MRRVVQSNKNSSAFIGIGIVSFAATTLLLGVIALSSATSSATTQGWCPAGPEEEHALTLATDRQDQKTVYIGTQRGDVFKLVLDNLPPEKATLISPHGTISTSGPTYAWNTVSGATWYYLWVNDSTNANGKIRTWYTAQQCGCDSGTGICSVTPSVPIASGDAQWWIQTWNSAGYGPWSNGMAFTVLADGVPGKATLISPRGTILTSSPTYSWNAESSATWYFLWVNDSTNAKGKIRTWYTAQQCGCASGTGICSVMPSVAIASGAAQWWIQTWNSVGYGPWSDSMVFNVSSAPNSLAYPIVDTGQTKYFDASKEITAPAFGQSFYGQDAQFSGAQASYTLSNDGKTVFDNVTKLTWMRGPNTTLAVPGKSDKKTFSEAKAWVTTVNAMAYGEFSDWRLPTIKELYSLMNFKGTDPSNFTCTDTSVLTPFIDTTYFNFAYGQTSLGERIIDSQYASSNLFVVTPAETGYPKLFGLNLADGRIEKTFFVQLVRGSWDYGINSFTDNGDGTVTDASTSLMWSKVDSGTPLTWEEALAWVQARNAANYLGYNDWRLPNAKELQSLVDYSNAPDYNSKPAIDTAFFTCTAIINENGDADYPYYWTSTTHAGYSTTGSAGDRAVYITFGRALGWPGQGWVDVHGAGAQRSDPKIGPPFLYATTHSITRNGVTYTGYAFGPQGDAIRGLNFVRLARSGVSGTSPSAAFTFSPTSPVSGQAVQFTDSSTGNPTAWSWNFGDGSTSTSQNPTHAYAKAGSYTVILAASNAWGSDTVSHTVIVNPTGTAPVAGFSFSPTAPIAGQTVSFTANPLYSENISGAQRLQNGNTIICSGGTGQFLEVTPGGEIVWKYICPVDPNGPMTQGTTPPIDPSHQSSGETMNSVFRIYKYPVDYAAFTGKILIPGDYVEKYSAGSLPVAAFTFAPSNPTSGQIVTFTNSSTGSPTAWFWNFGDSGTSSVQNPTHAYAAAGTFTVTLTASNGAIGSTTIQGEE